MMRDGSNSLNGVAEVYQSQFGNWSKICADGFGPSEARVVCKSLENGTDVYVNHEMLLSN